MSIKTITVDRNLNVRSFDSLQEAGHYHGFNIRSVGLNNGESIKPYRFHHDIAFCDADKIKHFSREILNQMKLKAQSDLNAKYVEALTTINKM